MQRSLLILLFSTFTLSAISQTIDTFEFRGFKRCKHNYLARFIQHEIGDTVRQKWLWEDEDKLNGLGYFESLRIFPEQKNDSTILVIEGKEVITGFPFGRFNGTKENVQIVGGFSDFNVGGRGLQLYLSYNYYNRHSFFGSLVVPYIKNTNWGSRHIIERFATLEPAGNNKFKIDRQRISTDISYEFKFGNKLFLGGGAFTESILMANNALPKPNYTLKYIGKIEHHFFNFTMKRMDMKGYFNTFYTEVVKTPGQADFWKGLNSFIAYILPAKGHNFAFRQNIGFSTNINAFFPAFVLDNYLNVRGIGDRTYRGSAEISSNFEYRLSLFENKKIGIQTVAFYDVATLRPMRAENTALNENIFHYVGLGFRGHIFRFYKLIFRGDLAFNTNDFSKRGFVVGIGQYF